jgi:hypothetical protein
MADIEAAKPSVEDVSLLLRTRTVGHVPAAGGLGGDTGPEDVTVFSDTTRPTAAEVQALIETSYDAMIGRLDSMLIDSQYEAFSHVVSLYTAQLIEISYFRETVNEALLGMWTQMINDTLGGIRLARSATTRRTSSLRSRTRWTCSSASTRRTSPGSAAATSAPATRRPA